MSRSIYTRLKRLSFRWRADQRGAVAFEVPFVFIFIVISFIIPIADFAIFGYRYISAFQALRNAGQYMQYHPPADVTSYTLPTSIQTISGYPISNPTVTCGGNPCTSTNANLIPKYYTYQTSFTLTPTPLMRSILCISSDTTDRCKYTLTYSERFQ